MDQLKQVPGLWLCEFQKKPFINDQQILFGVSVPYLIISAKSSGNLEFIQEIRQPGIRNFVFLTASRIAERICEECLTGTGCTSENDVMVLFDV